MHRIHFLHLKQTPILSQLRLEEALLRADGKNWCIVNEGSPPAIVMGISGKPHELMDVKRVAQKRIPVIRRFSGGGTVVVDASTLFVTLIFNAERVPISPYPEPILQWTREIYAPLFAPNPFEIRGQDYAILGRKCGGNAQYLRKGRWLHHSTFLWDWDEELMELLRHPPKEPDYRQGRSHADFLTRLGNRLPSRRVFINALFRRLEDLFEDVVVSSLDHASEPLKAPHRKATEVIDLGIKKKSLAGRSSITPLPT